METLPPLTAELENMPKVTAKPQIGASQKQGSKALSQMSPSIQKLNTSSQSSKLKAADSEQLKTQEPKSLVAATTHN